MILHKTDIENQERKYRLNLINSITGIKPANLIGTKSLTGKENLAIFSSVVHLGSNPGLLGFILRPTGEVPRHTHENILETEYYTINSIPLKLAKNAHYTSAKFDKEINEFERCKIEAHYLEDFKAPFVKESSIRIGLKLQDQVPIKINQTALIIGSIETLEISENVLDRSGYINLDKAEIAGISGLNSYYKLSLKHQFPYARVNETPEF